MATHKKAIPNITAYSSWTGRNIDGRMTYSAPVVGETKRIVDLSNIQGKINRIILTGKTNVSNGQRYIHIGNDNQQAATNFTLDYNAPTIPQDKQLEIGFRYGAVGGTGECPEGQQKTFTSSCTYSQLEITIELEDGTVRYGVNGEWKECLIYYGVDDEWKLATIYCGNNDEWNAC